MDQAQLDAGLANPVGTRIVAAEAGTVVAVNGEPGELVSPLGIRDYSSDSLWVADSWEVVVLVSGRRLPARVLAVALVAGMLAGCAGQSHGASPAPASTAGSQVTWMLTRSALSQVLSDPSVRPLLERTRVYELLQPGQRPLTGVSAEPVVTFSSMADLRGALAERALPPGIQAVLYDPEAWSYTPAAEQRNPVAAATQAAGLAHAHGLKIIVAPALNLTTVLAPGSSAPRWRQFLDLGLARSMARVADFVEVQAQSLERDPAAYAAFVREAAAQARAANPDVSVLAGLSTNPPGAAVDSQQLRAAIQASQADVDGYWLNIPGHGPRCPTCSTPQPGIGAEVLTGVL